MGWSDQKKRESGRRIVMAGTGGQGVLTVARLLCDFFASRGHNVVSGQLHGMAQRGGSVQASVKIDCGISPVISRGCADCVLGFEPVETIRALPFVSSRTVVYMNTAPVIPYVLGQRYVLKHEHAEYPDVERLLDGIRAVTRDTFAFDATLLATEAGSGKTLNMIMLGALMGCGYLPYTADEFWNCIARKVPAAPAEANARAFGSGAEFGKQCRAGRE